MAPASASGFRRSRNWSLAPWSIRRWPFQPFSATSRLESWAVHFDLVRAEIGRELLAAPVALRRIRDRGEGRERAEAFGMGHRDGQRAVAAHRVAGDALGILVELEIAEDQLGQFVGDVGPHAEVRRPGVLGGIDVETRALPQVEGVVIGDAVAAGRGVGEDDGDALRAHREALGAGLGHGVLVGAGQAGEIPQDGHGPLLGLGRQVDREGHVAAARLARVGVDALDAAEGAVLGHGLHGLLLCRFRTGRRSAGPAGSAGKLSRGGRRHKAAGGARVPPEG
jgi:hypothetical protein